MNWTHKDEWKCKGKNFLIVVSRHEEPVSDIDPHTGPNRWAVYAYIYPEHHCFGQFAGEDIFQEAASSMPLHCGPSFLKRHYDKAGEITSIQVGADYQHLHDDFTNKATKEDAYEVFNDAEALFHFLAVKP